MKNLKLYEDFEKKVDEAAHMVLDYKQYIPIEELIKNLEEIKAKHGNVDVRINSGDYITK